MPVTCGHRTQTQPWGPAPAERDYPQGSMPYGSFARHRGEKEKVPGLGVDIHGRRSYSYSPGMERGEHGGDSGVKGNVKIEASGEVDAARWSSGYP